MLMRIVQLQALARGHIARSRVNLSLMQHQIVMVQSVARRYIQRQRYMKARLSRLTFSRSVAGSENICSLEIDESECSTDHYNVLTTVGGSAQTASKKIPTVDRSAHSGFVYADDLDDSEELMVGPTKAFPKASKQVGRVPLQGVAERGNKRPLADNVPMKRSTRLKAVKTSNSVDNDNAETIQQSAARLTPAESMKVVELKEELYRYGIAKKLISKTRKAELVQMVQLERQRAQTIW
jgi:hypothetical protein